MKRSYSSSNDLNSHNLCPHKNHNFQNDINVLNFDITENERNTLIEHSKNETMKFIKTKKMLNDNNNGNCVETNTEQNVNHERYFSTGLDHKYMPHIIFKSNDNKLLGKIGKIKNYNVVIPLCARTIINGDPSWEWN